MAAKKSISGHTQWGTTFLVAAELERRGYTVTFTMGHNTPVADLMVGTDRGDQFWVDVKGNSSKQPWDLRPQRDRTGLFYVLVYFAGPSSPQVPDRFFVLHQAEANELVRLYRAGHPKDRGIRPGFQFKDAEPFESHWNILPAR